MNTSERKAEMRRRTKKFAGSIVRLFIALNKRREEQAVIGKQLLRSGTSVAANYREASRARSNVEFISKIEQCAQEADESQLWLELLHEDCGVAHEIVEPVWNEAEELISIFVTMSKRTKEKRES